MKLNLNSSIISVLLSSLIAFPDLILLQNKLHIDSGIVIKDDFRNDTINDCYGADVCELINSEDFIVVSEIISPVCLNFCNQNFDSEPGDCDSNGNSLWFAILPEDSLTNLILQIYTEFKPIVSVYKGNYCDSLTEIISCYDNKLIYLPSFQNSELTYVKIEAKKWRKII